MSPNILCIIITVSSVTKVPISDARAEFACSQADSVVEAAYEHGIKPEVLAALIYAESRWNPKLKGKSGECGLGQLIPRWSRLKDSDKAGISCKRLFDPKTNIFATARSLSKWIRMGGGKLSRGLAGYNAGIDGLKGKDTKRGKRGQRYARNVLRITRKYMRIFHVY